MRVLVTGAAGFIGGHLLPALLARGHEATGTDLLDKVFASIDKKPAVQLFSWDVRYQSTDEIVASFNPPIDAIVHLAAIAAPREAAKDPMTAWDTNVRGAYNVLDFARRSGVKRVVFFSSAHVLGISPKYLPSDEQCPRSLVDQYTATKILGEDLCSQFAKEHGLSYCALRLFNCFGKNQSPDYFLAKKLQEAKAGAITLMNAKVTKDWIHVKDVVAATVQALESDYVGPINIGTGVETSLETIAKRFAGAFGATITYDTSQDGSPTRMCCDWRLAKTTLKWEPKVSFQEGLEELIAEAKKC